METDDGSIRFGCAFSRKALRYNALFAAVPMLYCCAVVAIMAKWWWIMAILLLASVEVCMGVYAYLQRMARDSYIEITPDGTLNCCYRGRRKVSYPISEINAMEEAGPEEIKKRNATVPVVLNTRGFDMYPRTGVLITFNRSWIKSVFPVYFNPVDPQAFMAALTNGSRRGGCRGDS